MSFEFPTVPKQEKHPEKETAEEKPPVDLEAIALRLEQDQTKTFSPEMQAKRENLFAKYAEKLTGSLSKYAKEIALAGALALPMAPAVAGEAPMEMDQPTDVVKKKEEKKKFAGEKPVEFYQMMSLQERAQASDRHANGVKQAIDQRSKDHFEFHLGEMEKITQTIEDQVRKGQILASIKSYEVMGAIFFRLYGR